MLWQAKYIVYVVTLLILCSCHSVYQARSIDLEVVEPGHVKFSPQYRKVAIRYNNSNVAYNPYFSEYVNDGQIKSDSTNSDSIASYVYYDSFMHGFNDFAIFDSVVELPPADYSSVIFRLKSAAELPDSLMSVPAQYFNNLHLNYPGNPVSVNDTIVIDPKNGIYNKDQLRQIADTTGANMLLSLDYFAVNEIIQDRYPFINVFVLASWNFYDLDSLELKHYYYRIDTVSLENILNANVLSDRVSLVNEAAEFTGMNFAHFLVPHWVRVRRTIYDAPNAEMQKAGKLALENKWLEAAAIWRTLTTDSNKLIAAKSMFNMALACEVEGNLDAAIDWTVRSYHLFKEKNEVHAFNCKEYLRVLGLREQDIKQIEMQVVR